LLFKDKRFAVVSILQWIKCDAHETSTLVQLLVKDVETLQDNFRQHMRKTTSITSEIAKNSVCFSLALDASWKEQMQD